MKEGEGMKNRKPYTPGNGIFRDGDVIVSKDNFIFYTFGYKHPWNRVISFLKYIPSKLAYNFKLKWLSQKWFFKSVEMVRPALLYSPENYSQIIKSLKSHFPGYVFYDLNLKKWLIAPLRDKIKEVYRPNECLKKLLSKRMKDELEKKALNLIHLLSFYSKVKIDFFGIHGSISLGMHSEQSDIDVAVYGSRNYEKVIKTLQVLEKREVLEISRKNEVEERRMNTGFYNGKRFVLNATRLINEIRNEEEWKPLHPVTVTCEVADTAESMFRPVIYKVKKCFLEGRTPNVTVEEIVSMIGLYRSYLKRGEVVIVKGMLEKSSSGRYRVIIGSGLKEEFVKTVKK